MHGAGASEVFVIRRGALLHSIHIRFLKILYTTIFNKVTEHKGNHKWFCSERQYFCLLISADMSLDIYIYIYINFLVLRGHLSRVPPLADVIYCHLYTWCFFLRAMVMVCTAGIICLWMFLSAPDTLVGTCPTTENHRVANGFHFKNGKANWGVLFVLC